MLEMLLPNETTVAKVIHASQIPDFLFGEEVERTPGLFQERNDDFGIVADSYRSKVIEQQQRQSWMGIDRIPPGLPSTDGIELLPAQHLRKGMWIVTLG